jgi:uncharacterized protein YigE (DUF2233 family)
MNNIKTLIIMKKIIVVITALICMAFSCITSKKQPIEKHKATQDLCTFQDSIMRSELNLYYDTCSMNDDTLGVKSARVYFRGASYDIITVDTRFAELNFFYKDSLVFPNGYGLFGNLMKLRPCLKFLVNGGMYTYEKRNNSMNIRPLGLYVENGNSINPIDTAKGKNGNFYMQPNGIFLVGKNGMPKIIETEKFTAVKDSILHATQSGPMLIIKGEINKLFNEGSINRNIRNGVGIINSNTLVFAISNSPVNFYDFASLFKEQYSCYNALYLDGAISGAVIPQLLRDDSKNNLQYAVFIGAETKKKGVK